MAMKDRIVKTIVTKDIETLDELTMDYLNTNDRYNVHTVETLTFVEYEKLHYMRTIVMVTD